MITSKRGILTLYLFQWKILCKDSFPVYGTMVALEKMRKENLFGQHKKYDLF